MNLDPLQDKFILRNLQYFHMTLLPCLFLSLPFPSWVQGAQLSGICEVSSVMANHRANKPSSLAALSRVVHAHAAALLGVGGRRGGGAAWHGMARAYACFTTTLSSS